MVGRSVSLSSINHAARKEEGKQEGRKASHTKYDADDPTGGGDKICLLETIRIRIATDAVE
jgi:hypothetical protein